MNLNVKYNKNIKLKDLDKVNDLSCEIFDYYPKSDEIIGKLKLFGSYVTDNSPHEKKLDIELPFKIILDNPLDEVIDVDCTYFNYNVLDNSTLELSYEISVTLDNQVDNETFKQAITETKQQELSEIFLPEEQVKEETSHEEVNLKEQLVRQLPIKEKRTKIHIAYFDDDKQLDQISSKYGVPLNELYKNKNKGNDKYKLVIIKK